MNRMTTFSLATGHNEFYVISGSLAHIQRFIYDTSSSGALKNMRGRSFYLTLLTRAVCDYLLRKLNLEQNSVLFNSGGTFCIIAPYTDNIENVAQEAIKEIGIIVSNMVLDDIINICGIKASREDLENHCTEIFDKLFSYRHYLKFNPHKDTDYHSLFNGIVQPHKKSYDYLCTGLRNANAILVSSTKLSLNDCLCVDMGQLGTYFYMGNAHKLSQVVANDAYLLIINNEPEPMGSKLPIYRDYIAGNGTRANSFEDLFVNEDSSHKQLAVLRMDVDNLGSILRSKMAQPNALEAYSIFSHKLDAFFKGRINEMWNMKYNDSTVIIYAGGDDLFIVGEWEQTTLFMQDIYNEFKRQFDTNSMSVSAGVSFVGPKFPIVRAAEISGIEESRAKAFEYKGKQKCAISMFETPLRWDYEYAQIVRYKESLVKLIINEHIDKSFIQHIMQINENITYVDGKITPIRNVWLAAYNLSRMANRRNRNSDGVRFIEQCVADIMSGRTLDGHIIDSPYHSLQLITIAARLAQMTLWKINN